MPFCNLLYGFSSTYFDFIIGNDFLPHLPSLDIRDGALDYLFNVYKRILPTLGDYITNHGGEVNLSHVDVILAEVGSIEDFVFNMQHKNEQQEQKRRGQFKDRKKYLTKNGQAPLANHQGGRMVEDIPKVRGKAARILEQDSDMKALGKDSTIQPNIPNSSEENTKAAQQLKATLVKVEDKVDRENVLKRKSEDISKVTEGGDNLVKEETETPQDDVKEEEVDQAKLDEAAVILKKKMKDIEQKKLNDYSANVEDKVRLHDKGWKVS
jgi:5'-3' exoribonuclease 2